MSTTEEKNGNKSASEKSESNPNSSKEIPKQSRFEYDDDYIFQNTQTHEKIREYIILKEIGKGAFGSVFLVKKETNQKNYALKVINKDFLSRTEKTEEALIERLILSKCKHPSIVRLSSSFQTKYKLYFVMEYCPNKDLDILLRELGTFDNDLAFQIISELVNVIYYLHINMEISHNDLKPSNILLDKNFHIKLIDFSTSKVRNKVFDKKKGDFIDSENSISKDIIGTVEFVSPEMINQKITDYRTNDIWSLGIIIYMIFNGVTPFKGDNDFETLEKIKCCKYQFVKKDIPEDIIDLLNNILIEDDNKRFNIKQIKEHKYFKDVNWDTLLNNKVPISLEKLEEINKMNIELNNNENFWGNFCDNINKNNSENDLLKSENDYEIEKSEDFPPKINKNFFYSKESLEKMKNLNNMVVGVLKKCGFKEREIKMKLFIQEKKIEIFELEKNEFIKKYELNNKTKIKIENQNEFILDGDKYKTIPKEVEKWNNIINKIISS